MFFCYMKVDETNNIHNWWMSTSLRKVQVCGPRAETGSELGALKMYTRRNIVFLFNDIPHIYIYCITYLHKDVCISWLTISCHIIQKLYSGYRQWMYIFYRLLGCWSRLLLKAVALVIPTPLTPQPPPPADLKNVTMTEIQLCIRCIGLEVFVWCTILIHFAPMVLVEMRW